jgi:hypothetical protein
MEGGRKANQLEKLFQSHPPTAERIRKLEGQLAAAAPGGQRNGAAFAAAVKGL